MKLIPSNKNSRINAFKKDRNGHKLFILEMSNLPVSFWVTNLSVDFFHKSNGTIKIKYTKNLYKKYLSALIIWADSFSSDIII